MSDLAATNCGCGCEGERHNGCNIIFIILLLCCCGGNHNGLFGDNDNGGCDILIIILLLSCCGGNNGLFGGGCGC